MTNIDVEPVDRVDDDDAHDGHAEAGDAAESTELSVDVEERTTDGTDLPDRVDAPEYVLYGGKGGVGKTTMAAATALASAASGVSTLVVSTDPAHSLSDALGTPVPAEPAQVREDMPLYASEIDPDEVIEGPFAADEETGGFDAADLDADDNPFEDGGDDGGDAGGFGAGAGSGAGGGPGQGGAGANPFGMDMGGMEDVLGEMMGPGSMPGADEAAAMQQLLAYLDDPRFDRVVVDTAPTGHTLRLLELPELMDSMLGRIARMRQQFSGMMDQLKGMFGAGSGRETADLDELRERIERLRAVLRDPERTDFRVVMIPEEMSVVESKRLIDRLDGYEIPVQTLVVNRVMENLADVTTTPVDSEWVVSPNLEECEFCQRRWAVQQRALQRATDLFRGRNVKRVPLLADEVSGEEALRVVAACLG